MKRQIKTALLGIALFSTLAADVSAQHFPQPSAGQFSPPLNLAVFNDSISLGTIPMTDMRYRGPDTIRYTGGPAIPGRDFLQGNVPTPFPTQPVPGQNIRYSGGPAIPGRDFLQGNVPTPFPTQPVPGQNIRPTPGIPSQPFPGQNIQIPGQPINGLPRNIQMPQPQNKNLWHHNQRQNIVGGTYRDGQGGTIRGSIDGVTQGNLDMGVDSQFAGVRGGVRGGIEAQGHTEVVHDIYGMPVNQYASGNVFLGTEAQAQAGLSREGLGVGAGGFAGARAQMTRGVDLGVVDYSETIEGQVGVGAEASAHLGLQDGRFRINGELGAAVGIGAKMGVDAEVDLGETGRFVERTGNSAIRTGGAVVRDVDRWGNQAGRDISRTTNNASNSVKRSVNKTGNDVKKTANKVGGGIKKIGKSIFGK